MCKTRRVWGEITRVLFSLGGPARHVYETLRLSESLAPATQIGCRFLNVDKSQREITANHTDLVHKKVLRSDGPFGKQN